MKLGTSLIQLGASLMEFKNFIKEVRSLFSEAQNFVVVSLSVKKRSPIAGNKERESVAKPLGVSHTLLLTVGG